MTFLRSKLVVITTLICCFSAVISCEKQSQEKTTVTPKVIPTEKAIKTADSLFEAGRQLYYKREFNASVHTFLKADSLFIQQENIARSLKSRINIATALQATYIENDSIDRFLKAGIPLIEQLDKEALEVVEYYNKLEEVNYAAGNYAVSKSYIVKSIQRLQQMTKKDGQARIVAYSYALHALTVVEQELFNYRAAESFAKSAVDYSKKNKFNVFSAEMELFNTYVLSDQYTEANKQLKHIESKGLVDEKDIFNTFDFYRSKIQFYTKIKEYKGAFKAVNDLQKIIDNSGYKEHFSQWFLTQIKSDIFLEIGMNQKVISFIESLQIEPTYENATIGYRSGDFLRLAKAHYNLSAFEPNHETQWQENIQKAINLHVPEASQTDDFFKEVSYQNARFKDFLYTHLLFKAKTSFAVYQKINDERYLKIALHTFKEAHANLKTLGARSNEDEFIKAKEFDQFYNDLLLAFHQKWIKNNDSKLFFEALTISDESKNVFILNELKRTSEKKLFDNIPIEIRKKEAYLQEQLEATEFTKESGNIQEEFNRFKAEIREKHPKYYALKYTEETPIEKVISTQLKDYNSISYTVTNDYIFIFNYNAGNLKFDKIVLNETLKTTLKIYSESVANRFNDSYKEQSETVFNRILKKYIDPEKTTVLLLDGILNTFPFDLFRESIDYKKPFVRLNNLRQNIYNSHKNTAKTIVFAPLFDNTKGTRYEDILPSSYQEATTIEDLTNAVMKTGKLALKQTFIETSSEYDIIHLSTHSEANAKLPMQSQIHFYPEDNQPPSNYILKVKSLYDMSFSADLVTLSSCESGVGTNESGKGVQSIANAFHYAGAKSTVMSLWKVSDRTTATIMGLFYKNLKTGLDKATALQRAKKMYIAQTDDENFKHPYYWAGFVISGDISPIVFPKTSNTYYYYAFTIILVFFIFWMLYKRRKMIKLS
jgi:CHAT domain-containing protein